MAEAPGRILVVEDDADIAALLSLNLALAGYRCTIVDRGDEAVAVAVRERPDLVLLDVMLPGTQGVDVCRALRKDPRTSGAGILMVTAKDGPGDRVAGLDAGADDYIVKPFDVDELLARVQSALRRNLRLRGSSPLTGLPGNFEILERLNGVIADDEPFALLHIDVDGFKSFNDHYGFVAGDEAIVATGRVVQRAAAEHAPGAFVGHIGGDDFAVVCVPEAATAVAEAIVRDFDSVVPTLYAPEDLDRGYLEVPDRRGERQRFPLVAVSVGIATTELREFGSAAEAAAVASEMKSFAKASPGSSWARDRRRAPGA